MARTLTRAGTKSTPPTMLLLCWLAAGCLALLPGHATDRARAWYRHSLAPAWWLAGTVRAASQKLARWCQGTATRGDELAQLRAQLAQARLQIASLQATLEQQRPPLADRAALTAPGPLRAELVPARVLGRQARSTLEQMELIGAGSSRAVRPEALVLSGTTRLRRANTKKSGPANHLLPDIAWIDAGRHAGITEASHVLCAGLIWGRVADVGQHCARVRRVCHPLYRDVVQLATPHARGLQPGPRGLLRGGSPCRVELVDAREPVRPGDLVLAADEQGLFGGPLIYGTVSRARHEAGQPHWQIEVQPLEPPCWVEDVWVVCALPRVRQPQHAEQDADVLRVRADLAQGADQP